MEDVARKLASTNVMILNLCEMCERELGRKGG